jgi:hypothetical protein
MVFVCFIICEPILSIGETAGLVKFANISFTAFKK